MNTRSSPPTLVVRNPVERNVPQRYYTNQNIGLKLNYPKSVNFTPLGFKIIFVC